MRNRTPAAALAGITAIAATIGLLAQAPAAPPRPGSPAASARPSGPASPAPAAAPPAPSPAGLEYIDTGFENASPLWYEPAADGTIQIHLLYDSERSSPNRAAGHIHFLVHGRPGAKLTFEFRNLDNVWNRQAASVAPELKTLVVSPNGRDWRPAPTISLPGNRVQLAVEMPGPRLYVARVEPYRLSDLDALLRSIQRHPLVTIATIGRTVGGRPLEIVHVGRGNAPYRVFVRARAHPWEAGSSWVAQGLIERLLKDDAGARTFLEHYSVDVLPMANKDGVARGLTRFNGMGRDLNRNWDQPVDADLVPENRALEQWLEGRIAAKEAPHLALELHNDARGLLHISRPPVAGLARHLERMATLEGLLRTKTWFTEGTTSEGFRNTGTLGDGWFERYGIDAAVHEFNCNWIEGLKDYPSARHWKTYGGQLADVFDEYFRQVKP